MLQSRMFRRAGRVARSATSAFACSFTGRFTVQAVVASALLAGAVACSAHDGSERAGDASDGGTVASRPATSARSAQSAPSIPAHTTGAAGTALAASGTANDTLLASAEVYAGWRAFNVNCQSCHGFNAVASDVAPDLRSSVGSGGTVTHAQFREVVKKGRMAKGMPAWGELLDAKQIEQIYAYLLARSSGALGAGQPIVGGE